MFLQAIATAVPEASFSQSDCWDIVVRSRVRDRLKKRSVLILQSILRGDHGIDRRHFAMPDIEQVFDRGPDELNDIFRREAPRLAGRALRTALERASLRPADLDVLLVCTCTGYVCPGVSSYVAEALGLRPNAFLQDLVGLGCGAAIPMLRAARHIAKSQPDATIACVAVELCSAAFFLDDDPGVIISACLFSDGAAATIWRGTPPVEHAVSAFDFNTVHLPQNRDKLRFEQRHGKLRNLLHRSVPELAADAVARLWAERDERPVSRVVAHAGGRDVIEAVTPVVAPHSLELTSRVLRRYGNMSSPSVLFALEEALHEAPPNGRGDYWLVSFGAGFAAHSCRIGVLA